MANGNQQQQPQQQQPQPAQRQPAQRQPTQQPGFTVPESQPFLIAMDDYVYEAKPPKKPFDDVKGTDQQAGGMSGQFEAVSSALNKNI
jgi:hypothetical protein